MDEGDLPAAVLTRSPETWSKSPELGCELHLVVSDLSVDTGPQAQGGAVPRSVARLRHAMQMPSAQVGHRPRGLLYERSRARAASRDVRG